MLSRLLFLTFLPVLLSYTSIAPSRRAFLSRATAIGGVFLAPLPGVAREEPLAYLSEPTEEFKKSEAQRAEFRKEQVQIKKAFDVVLTRFTESSKKEAEIVKDLNELQDLTIRTGGLPTGLKADDVKKTVRRKKALGNWTTSEEIAYQALCREIAFQQNPNKDKDIGNPL